MLQKANDFVLFSSLQQKDLYRLRVLNMEREVAFRGFLLKSVWRE
jgi:hypothetical protein